MIPSSKQRGAGDRAEGRQPAMGIWIIHSAHFINIIMEETERAERERGLQRRNGRRNSKADGGAVSEQIRVQGSWSGLTGVMKL